MGWEDSNKDCQGFGKGDAMSLKKNIVVIGLGYWGKNLVRNFSEVGVLYGLCDLKKTQVQKFSERYKVERVYCDYRDILKDDNVDALVIATPAITHYNLVREALNADKDVFVEKPLALNVGEAEELNCLARSKGRVLMVDHILRYHPAIIKLKELIDDNVLGDLQYIYSHRLNIGLLRSEENILWSFAPHDISVILYLAEKLPKNIQAFGSAYIQPKVLDTTMMNLDFGDKLKAHIFVSWLHPFKEQKLVVIGNKNMAVFDDMEKEDKLVLFPHTVEWQGNLPVANKAQGKPVLLKKKEPLKEACLHFIKCMETRESCQTDGFEGVKVLNVIKRAQSFLEESS